MALAFKRHVSVRLIPADGRLSLRESTLGRALFRGAKGDHLSRDAGPAPLKSTPFGLVPAGQQLSSYWLSPANVMLPSGLPRRGNN
jgi:hypothetical protein